ncbi:MULTISPECIES: LysR family transcriptional regulator [Mesorhizobium]|uniref:LysR family transcriptional regulator n=1 Tax=Mesorhizobium denitrificans TaxID=2294114 RepID=A0A371X631_9HYPH|nr:MULTISPECIES: LysR family transcriptional regulator [Mesorhizobium]RFC64688.1 LysR family transcriptional regulator [Mesorhizobium denitrificans]
MNAQVANWDDLRVFLAVARTGSLSGAARSLSVNHSTVFRRIAGFEAALGVRLFERLPNGYALTPAGEETLGIVERIEADVAMLDRTVTGQDLRLSGTVRITAIDMLAFWLLPDHLARFHAAYPGIEIEMVVGNEALNLSRRETDIALRIGNTPPETLVGRQVGRLDFAIYGALAYCAARPDMDLTQQDWIGLDNAHAPLARRFETFLPGVRPVIRSNSVACTVRLAKAGLGLAVLPCVIADQKQDLIRVAEVPDTFSLDLWLLTHEDLRHTARIRAVLDFLAAALSETMESVGKGAKA